MPVLTRSPVDLLGPRDEPHVITQTITRVTTTFTTLVTLGGGPTNYSGNEVESEADIYGGSGDGSGLTNVQLGAIIGSSIAFVLILVVTWCFIMQARRRLEDGSSEGSVYSLTDSTHSSSSGGSPPPPMPPPRAERRRNIPGGPKYPTYRAMPVRNPRANPSVRRTGSGAPRGFSRVG